MTRLVPVIAAALLLAAGCGQTPPTSQVAETPPATVTTAAAVSRPHASVELIPGTVRAARAATIMARVQGAVKRIEAEPGRPVAAGDLLLELDALEIAARRDQAKATAARAAADFERARMLFEKQATTKAEYDAAQARAAEGAAAAAEAEVLVGYTRIQAPFAGVVVRKHVEVGDLVSPGRAVVDIEDPATLRLEVEVPESLASRVVLGATLRVQVGSAGLDLDAPVVEISPAADPVSRSVLVKAALPADAKGLRSGQFGRAAIATAAGDAITVPSAAVVHRGQLDAVFVVRDGRAAMRLVRLGGRDGDAILIRAGLAAGETVVVAGAGALVDGQRVTNP